MRGHLQHRSGGSGRIKVCLGRSADGRKRHLERTVHSTRPDAERELSCVVVEVDEDRHAAAAPMTFASCSTGGWRVCAQPGRSARLTMVHDVPSFKTGRKPADS